MTAAERVRRDPLVAALWLVLGASALWLAVVRLRFAATLPLWLDESFTAVIASQPDWSALWHQIWLDPSAPLYYVLMWLLPAADSHLALRLPGLVLTFAAAALPLAWRIPGLPRFAAIAWAALLLLWSEANVIAVDARPYGLLLLLITAQTIAFARLLDRPSLARASLWTALSALAILTHYYAGALGLVQGLALIAVLRRGALRLWPALLLLLVPLAVLAWHWPRLAIYAAPDVAWYPPQTVKSALLFGGAAVGLFWRPLWLLAIAGRAGDPRATVPRDVWVAALSGFAAIAVLLVLGTLRPALTERYLTIGVPGLLLVMLLVAGNRPGQLLLVALFALVSTQQLGARLADRSSVGLERPSRALATLAPAPQRLVYSLGYRGQRVLDPGTMAQVGAFDFARRGQAVDAAMVRSDDPAALVAAAGDDAALIWVYHGDHRAALDHITASRRCRDLPRSDGGTLVCAPLSAGR